jgi:hypothetical protein
MDLSGNKKPKDTYKGILTLTDNAGLTTTLKSVGDGNGGYSPLQLSTTQIAFAGFAGASTANIVWRANSILTDYTGWHQSDGSYKILTKDAASIFININDGVNFSAGFSSTGRTTINAAGNWSLGGSFTNAARLHVRGDGTNPVGRFEGNSGINIASFRQSDYSLIFGIGTADTFAQVGLQTLNNPLLMNTGGNGHMMAYRSNFNRDWPGPMHSFFGTEQAYNAATQTNNPAGIAFYNGTFGITNVAASTFDYRMVGITYTINNTAVSNRTATGIFLNATETALNGMTHNLMDLQVNGNSRFRISTFGEATFSNTATIPDVKTANIWSASNNITLRNAAYNGFNLLQFGGTTNAFPAIKRNSAAIEFVTADGVSGYCDIVARQYTSYYGAASGFQIHSSAATALTGFTIQSYNTTLGGKILTLYSTSIFEADATAGGGVTLRGSGDTHTAEASALFAMKSITKGFLPPRMDDTEVRAIPSPAEGLVVFNTDITHLCILNYSGM